ncbi:MAG: SDR family NAD(P)-dependent oxidoreductase, partial [Patulibacter sp.]|nr:SDR family NAD(P)-dependent oxidoreductase [Patulibacter sp.]
MSRAAESGRTAGIVAGRAGIVTGAAGGIGRAAAIRFAEEGADVVVNDVDAQRTGAEETVALVEAAGGRAVFVPGDVSDAGDQRALVDRCVAEFGALDFAHNNAAIAINATVEDAEEDDWDAMMRVNLKGVWLGMKHQLTQMLLATVPEEHHAVLYGINAIKRLSEPEEVAETVV